MSRHLHDPRLTGNILINGVKLQATASQLNTAQVASPQAFSILLPGDVSTGSIADVILSVPQAGTVLSTTVRSSTSSGTALLLRNGAAATDQFQFINASGSTLVQNIAVAQGDRLGFSIAVANFGLADVMYQVTWVPG